MSDKLLPLVPSHWLPRSTSQEPLVSPVQEEPYHEAVDYQRRILQRNASFKSNVSLATNISSLHITQPSNQSAGAKSEARDTVQYEVGPAPFQPNGHSNRSQDSWLENLWLYEVLAELIAIGSLVLMLGVLYYFNDRPQGEWQFSHVTLNGVVSFLATVTRTCLMVPVSAAIGQRKWLWFLSSSRTNRKARRLEDFETFDDASRGTLGSMKLFYSTKLWDLVCLGALITILSVFFDAMAQNVLSSTVVAKDGRSTGMTAGRVPRSDFFNSTTQIFTTALDMPAQFDIDVPTAAAVYTGLLADNVADLPISCSTGNCTWPKIETLGMCGACVDVKDRIEQSCNATDCIWHVPGGLNVTRPINPSDEDNWWVTMPIFQAGPSSGVTVMEANLTGNTSEKPGIAFAFLGLSSAKFMGMNDHMEHMLASATPWDMSNITAAECGLWVCNQTRQANASAGIITDTVVSSSSAGWVLDPLATTLGYILTGEINIDGNWEIGYNMTSRWDWVIPRVPSFGVDALHAAWYYADDVDKWWANLVKSLSNTIRTNGLLLEEEGTKYDGIAWVQVVHVKVRWVWLALPAALVLLSTIFLVATIIASRRSTARSWKNRALPLLYARLDDDLQESERLVMGRGERSFKIIGKARVRLDDRGYAWVFRGAAGEKGID